MTEEKKEGAIKASAGAMLIVPRIEVLDEAANKSAPVGTVVCAMVSGEGVAIAKPEEWFRFGPLCYAAGEKVGLQDQWVAFIGTFVGRVKINRVEEDETEEEKKTNAARVASGKKPVVKFRREETVEGPELDPVALILHEDDLVEVGEQIMAVLRSDRRRGGRAPGGRAGKRQASALWAQSWVMRSVVMHREGGDYAVLRTGERGARVMPEATLVVRRARYQELQQAVDADRVQVNMQPFELARPKGRQGAVRAGK